MKITSVVLTSTLCIQDVLKISSCGGTTVCVAVTLMKLFYVALESWGTAVKRSYVLPVLKGRVLHVYKEFVLLLQLVPQVLVFASMLIFRKHELCTLVQMTLQKDLHRFIGPPWRKSSFWIVVCVLSGLYSGVLCKCEEQRALETYLMGSRETFSDLGVYRKGQVIFYCVILCCNWMSFLWA